jgi:HSP20 family protein
MANIVRWDDPFSGLTNLHSQLDDMFNTFFTNTPTTPSGALPNMDIYTEDDKNLVAEVYAPGFGKNDIEINVHNDVLEIKGEKHEKDEKKDKKRSYMMRESHASFYRSVALPKSADTGKVEARFDNGVLKVIVPLKELPKPKKIAISGDKKK